MTRSSRPLPVAALLVVLSAATACGSAHPARSSVADAAPDPERPGYTEADVRFMQAMITHHAQAVRMTGLVPSRTDDRSLRVLAKRIGISQRDEIALMQRWLRERGHMVPRPDLEYPPEGGDDMAFMAGMLTREQMARLAAASGTEFYRLFLRGMIEHHRGALTMVDQLFGTRGAAQDPLTFELATEIAAVQNSQIARMRALLAELPAGISDPG